MALSDFVSINITVGTAAPTAQGFGVPLVLSNGTGSAGSGWTTSEVRTYRTFNQVASDFDSNDFPYQAAQALFSQSPRPEQMKVALLPTPSNAQTFFVGLDNIASGSAITGSLVSPAGSVSVILANPGAVTSDTALNLANAIGAINGISASATGNTVTATAGTEGEMWHFTADLNGISIYDSSPDFGYDDHLDEVLARDPAFYAVVVDNNSAKNIDKVARWAASNNKLAVFAPQFTRPADWGDSLFTAGADRTALLANDNAVLLFTKDARTNAKEAGWLGRMLPEDPGTATWAFKQLNSVGADSWTETEKSTINDHDDANPELGGNHYTTESGLNITFPGKSASGEFIDVVRTRQWLQARMEERIFGLFANSRKVPYTNKGFAMITAEVKAQLAEAERREVIDSGWEVTILPVDQQSSSDRANRIVRSLEFTARLAGAVHKVFVVGTVTV